MQGNLADAPGLVTPTLTHWNGKPIAELDRADFVDMVRAHAKIGAAGGALVAVKGAQQAGRLSAIHSVHMLPGAAGALRPRGGDRTSPPVADEDESQARHAGGRL